MLGGLSFVIRLWISRKFLIGSEVMGALHSCLLGVVHYSRRSFPVEEAQVSIGGLRNEECKQNE